MLHMISKKLEFNGLFYSIKMHKIFVAMAHGLEFQFVTGSSLDQYNFGVTKKSVWDIRKQNVSKIFNFGDRMSI